MDNQGHGIGRARSRVRRTDGSAADARHFHSGRARKAGGTAVAGLHARRSRDSQHTHVQGGARSESGATAPRGRRNKRKARVKRVAAVFAIFLLLFDAFFSVVPEDAFAGGTVTKITSTEDYVDTGNKFTCTYSNMSVSWNVSAGSTRTVTTSSGNTLKCLCIKRSSYGNSKGSTSGFSISGTVCTVTFSDAATIGGEYVDVVLTFSDLSYNGERGSKTSGCNSTYVQFGYADKYALYLGGYGSSSGYGYWGGLDVDVKVQVKWADDSTSTGLKCWMAMKDIDSVYTAKIGTYYEGWESLSGFSGTYYIYDNCKLSYESTSSGYYFYAGSDLTDYDSSDDDTYHYLTVYAPTSGSTFSMTYHLGWGTIAFLTYSVYDVMENDSDVTTPAKSASVSAASVDDTISWYLTFEMPEFYVDTYTKFSSLSWTDVLPDEVEYVSATMQRRSSSSSSWSTYSSAGTASYDEDTNTLTYTFSSSFLSGTSYYNGYDYRLVIKTTVGNDFENGTKITNTAVLDADGVEYSGSKSVTLSCGELDISKTVAYEEEDEEEALADAAEREFAFTVALTDSDGEALDDSYGYKVVDSSSSTVETGYISSGGTLYLQDGDTATIYGFGDGVSYSVTEEESDLYESSAEGDSGDITVGSTSTAAFTNTFVPSIATWTPAALVEFITATSGTALSQDDGEFSFQVVDENGDVVSTGTSASDGSIAFSDVNIRTEGTYTYILSQVADDAGGVDYDDAEFTVTVEVATEYVSDDAGADDDSTTDDATSEGDDATSEDEMSEDDDTATDSGDDASEDASEDETTDGDATGDDETADDSAEETGTPVLVVTVTYSDSDGNVLAVDDVLFTNTYSATGTWTPTVTKLYTNSEGESLELSDGAFSFQVFDEDGGALLTGENASDGSVGFGTDAIEYNEDNDGETFTYTVSEVVPTDDEADPDIQYDTSICTAVVSVTDNGDGTISTATVYYDADGNAIDSLSFTNVYDHQVVLSATGGNGVWVWIALPLAVLGCSLAVLIRRDAEEGR